MKKRLGTAVLDDFLDKSRYVTSKQIQSPRIILSTAATFYQSGIKLFTCVIFFGLYNNAVCVCVCVGVCVREGDRMGGGLGADLNLIPVNDPD